MVNNKCFRDDPYKDENQSRVDITGTEGETGELFVHIIPNQDHMYWPMEMIFHLPAAQKIIHRNCVVFYFETLHQTLKDESNNDTKGKKMCYHLFVFLFLLLIYIIKLSFLKVLLVKMLLERP